MYGLKAIFKKELLSYFVTPIAYVFIAIFLMTSSSFTFYLSDFYGRGQADLQSFFDWHPWLYIFLMPAISMRLWAEEKKSGTLEIISTLPVPLWQMVAGKFLAAWAFTAITLFCTFPIWVTACYLGDPDNGIIFISYIGSLLMAGGYLAIGSFISATTRNQVIAFVISALVCFLFTISGFPMVLNFFQGWLPGPVLNAIAGFSFLTNFGDITKGILEIKSLWFFLTFIVFWLFINSYILSTRKR